MPLTILLASVSTAVSAVNDEEVWIERNSNMVRRAEHTERQARFQTMGSARWSYKSRLGWCVGLKWGRRLRHSRSTGELIKGYFLKMPKKIIRRSRRS